ncbi:MAG: TerB family tellurite resistance protein [Pseudomonadales bacterium]|nr:TerB family tellurite resistance protein [Pseudomonadales bacterium]
MLKNIRKLFIRNPSKILTEEEKTQRLQVATAALLFEIARADLEISALEKDKIRTSLSKHFNLSSEILDQIIQQAETEVEQSISLHQFTKLIHDNYSLEEKKEIIYFLWAVAYCDEELDMYEESLIRKIADLLYIPHQDFIKAKLRAQKKQGIHL